MRGILKPCRHRLGPELHARWVSHLCGLCLTLRDTAGQAARVLTGYDVLLVPVLVEAQAGRQERSQASPCPLRGFRTASVVDQHTPAMQVGAAAALLTGASTLEDKLHDGDTPGWSRPVLSGAARRFTHAGVAAASRCQLPDDEVLTAWCRASDVEKQDNASLDDLLEPAAGAAAALLAHTAEVAGKPGNAAPLRRAGDALGRIIHLCDAVDDREADRRRGQFNPLSATRTSDEVAAAMARRLHADLLAALDEVELVDGALAEALLGPTLAAAIDSSFGSSDQRSKVVRPNRPGMAAVVTGLLAWGRRRPRRGDPSGYDAYGYGPGPGYGRRGCGNFGCGEILACDCCANCLCDSCGEDDCCCCVI